MQTKNAIVIRITAVKKIAVKREALVHLVMQNLMMNIRKDAEKKGLVVEVVRSLGLQW